VVEKEEDEESDRLFHLLRMEIEGGGMDILGGGLVGPFYRLPSG
jgi:hypothetical protein